MQNQILNGGYARTNAHSCKPLMIEGIKHEKSQDTEEKRRIPIKKNKLISSKHHGIRQYSKIKPFVSNTDKNSSLATESSPLLMHSHKKYLAQLEAHPLEHSAPLHTDSLQYEIGCLLRLSAKMVRVVTLGIKSILIDDNMCSFSPTFWSFSRKSLLRWLWGA